jgi:peptide subunit release factor 1 (eRF1)
VNPARQAIEGGSHVNDRLNELARMKTAASPVVSVYLNTRWVDEHQRDRVRVFLKNELRRAREQATDAALREDLDWVEAEGRALIDQERFPEARGVALFACRAAGLREILPIRVPFSDTFVVAGTPHVRPLSEQAEHLPRTLVVFVDSERARLIPLHPDGHDDEVVLESEVPGRHSRGGWAQLAQSRYQRHILDHRGRHFEAVAEAVRQLATGNGTERIVMAGDVRNVNAFRKHLPAPVDQRVVGTVPGAQHDSTPTLVARAADVLSRLQGSVEADVVDTVLTAAAKRQQAVAGPADTVAAVNRGAVHRLFMLRGFRSTGSACMSCGALQVTAASACHLCGHAITEVELGEAMAERVASTGGEVRTVAVHAPLGRAGGVAAALRYPL